MVKPIIVLILAFISHSALAAISPYENCILSMLAQSCVISADKKAPRIMRREGAAACFVGKELAPVDDKKISGFYQKYITQNNLNRELYLKEIKTTNKCISDPDYLKNCSLVVVYGGALNEIESCRYFISRPVLELKTTQHGLVSNAYKFVLSEEWLLVDKIIAKDSRKFIFKNKDGATVQLSVSEVFENDKYKEIQKQLKAGIKQVWNAEGMKLLEHSTRSLAEHESLDEQIGKDMNAGVTIAQYYLYGVNRMAILSYSRQGNVADIINLSRPIVKKFSWQ